ncbi:MAG: dipeptidase [Bacteroidota bacterium]
MSDLRNMLIGLLSLSIISCENPGTETPNLEEQALQLAQATLITDGHVDLPYRMRVRNFRLEKEFLDVSKRTEGGDFDYVRSKEGGLDAPFMSIYVPASYQEESGRSKAEADSLIDMVEEIVERYPDQYALAKTADEVEANFKAGKISLPMGMENGSPIEDELANVEYFYNRGIRYITLTHSLVNKISDSSYDTTRTWNGLSPFGEEVVQEMNRVGIMVDISHVSDSAFYDVMKLTSAPAIASHSSCRKFTPGFERNMSDDMIRALAENGGVIQINFGSTFLDSVSRKRRADMRAAMAAYQDELGKELTEEDQETFSKQYFEENGSMYSDVKVAADHVEHVIKLVGVDYVGFGSDFDGVGDSLPLGLKDVSDYPNLIAELLKRGYSEEDIQKICYKNVFRVWRKVEEIARNSSL